jgi:muramoyltetrapeptide carboxypeptidase
MRSVTVPAPVENAPQAKKPRALVQGSILNVITPASPAPEAKVKAGLAELRRLGFSIKDRNPLQSDGYFAGSVLDRFVELSRAVMGEEGAGLVALRGGYGSNYLLGEPLSRIIGEPKAVIGYSDLSSLQIFLWQRHRWVTFYGPMVAAGFDAGSGAPGGYDEASFRSAIGQTSGTWSIALSGDALIKGEATGRLLGGAMTLVEATIGTPWELDTRDAILVLEDRAMKPYQIDRVLMHFKQAGKLESVRGIVLGDFPECEPPVAGSPTVRDVCARILGELKIPMVFGAPIGHTARPMLTLPLGVQARLRAQGEDTLEILEPAVTP